jgi:GNAT superfamily N-acetyltransferase
VSDTSDVTIRPVSAADESDWRRLWTAFNAFHGATLSEDTKVATWARILDPASPISALVAVQDGVTLAIADYVLHAHTWSIGPCCLLDDLYVDEPARGRGIGRRLLEALIELGRHSGWSRVYWLAIEGADAMKLYDKYWTRDDVVRYTVTLIPPS